MTTGAVDDNSIQKSSQAWTGAYRSMKPRLCCNSIRSIFYIFYKILWKQSNEAFIEGGTTDAVYGVDLAYIVFKR